MKLKNPKITFLVGTERTTIEITDTESVKTFIKITLTPEQLSSALSRLSRTDCEVEVHDLDLVGKKREMDTIEFEMPEHKWENRDDVAYEKACELAPEGWEVRNYFGAKDNWFYKDEKN